MKSTFLSHEQVFEKPLRALKALGAAAPASDLARMTAVDDGFLTEDTGGINYYLAGGKTVDRFGRSDPCAVCAVRPVILLEEGDENLLRRIEEKGSVTTAEYGFYPTAVLDRSLRELAQKSLKDNSLQETGRSVTVAGEKLPVYLLSSREVILLPLQQGVIRVRTHVPNPYMWIRNPARTTPVLVVAGRNTNNVTVNLPPQVFNHSIIPSFHHCIIPSFHHCIIPSKYC